MPQAYQPEQYKPAENKAIQEMDWVKEKMQQARLQRDQMQAQGAFTDSGNSLRRDSYQAGNRLSGFFSITHRLPWLAGGMAVGGVIVLMVWKTGLVDLSNTSRANVIPGGMPAQQRGVVELPAQFTTDTEGLRNDIALLAEQVHTLTVSVSDLETKLQSIHAMTDSIAALGNELAPGTSQQPGAVSETVTRLEEMPSPVAGSVIRLETLPSPAAGSSHVSDSTVKDVGKSKDVSSTSLAVAKIMTPAAPEIKPRETIAGTGPWVINLVSVPNKADAERFMEKARSSGVSARLYQVTVKGTDYWRVQVSGYSSAADAKSGAKQIKEKLGLRDVWIAKQ